MSEPTAEQLQTWLTSALAARHNLLTGAAVAEVETNGRKTTYAKSDFDKLDSYIASLREQLAAIEAPASRRRPIHLSF